MLWNILSDIWLIISDILIYLQFPGFSKFKTNLNYKTELAKLNKQLVIDPNHIGNIFREGKITKRYDLSALNGIISLDHVVIDQSFHDLDLNTIDVGGSTTFHDISTYLIPKGFSLPVNPEFSTITVGGAISGVAIESSSFKYGLVHDSVLELDILLSNGEVITVSDGSDLFNAIPNSYGSLGYITRAKLRIIPIKPYVLVKSTKYESLRGALDAFHSVQEAIDFAEIITYANDRNYLVTGLFTDYHVASYYGVFYKDIQSESSKQMYMTTYDYYWRWDRDMFWGVAEVPLLSNYWFRRLTRRVILNSRVLRRIQRVLTQSGIPINENKTRVVQDLGVPYNRTSEFCEYVTERTGITPIWICPFIAKSDKWLLWNLKPGLYCDVGVFGSIEENKDNPTRDLESKMFNLGGKKCFYSDNHITLDEFDREFNGKRYQEIRKKYDPLHIFKDLQHLFTRSD